MDKALAAARFLHFAATMALFGASLFPAALAPPKLAEDLGRRLRAPGLALAALSLASAVAWAALVARDMAGGDLDTETLRDALTETAFGHVWLGRLAILALLLAAVWRPDRRWRRPAVLAGLALASLGLTGHAAMQEGALGTAHRANHAVHLLAASAWVGGLPLFLICLRRFAASADRGDVLCAMRRYSRAGHVFVAAALVSGALDVGMTVGALPWPPNSPYRILLDVKIAAVVAMTVVALANRYAIAPRIGRSGAAAQALAVGACAEVALSVAIVALVSMFGLLDPVARS